MMTGFKEKRFVRLGGAGVLSDIISIFYPLFVVLGIFSKVSLELLRTGVRIERRLFLFGTQVAYSRWLFPYERIKIVRYRQSRPWTILLIGNIVAIYAFVYAIRGLFFSKTLIVWQGVVLFLLGILGGLAAYTIFGLWRRRFLLIKGDKFSFRIETGEQDIELDLVQERLISRIYRMR